MSAEDEHGHGVSLTAAKVAVLVVAGFVTLGASLAPWVATTFLSSKRALDFVRLAAALSAGLIMGTLLIHMLPEAGVYFDGYFQSRYPEAEGEDEEAGAGHAHDHGNTPAEKIAAYPWSMVICGAVFIILLTLEHLFSFHIFHGLNSPECAPQAATASSTPGASCEHQAVDVSSKEATGASASHGHSHGHVCDHVTAPLEALAAHIGEHGKHVELTPTSKPASASATTAPTDEPTTASVAEPASPSSWSRLSSALGCSRTSAVVPASSLQISGTKPSHLAARAWVFALAMSFHGLLDGFGIGIDSEADGFAALAVAVVFHKLFDGVALGSAVFLANLSVAHRWFILLLTAAVTPIGIGIGMGILEGLKYSSEALQLAQGIVFSAAAGSFLFIALLELLPSALSDGRLPFLKIGTFTGGFLLMAILGAYV